VDSEHNLNVRYVDIASLVPPAFDPVTRTYFKCSIDSPSQQRLHTVVEETSYSEGQDHLSS